MRRSSDGPNKNRDTEATTSTYSIIKFAGESLARGVGDKKPGGDARKLQVAQTELRSDYGSQNGNCEAVYEVYQCGEKNEACDPPTQAAHSKPIANCRLPNVDFRFEQNDHFNWQSATQCESSEPLAH